MNQESEIKKWIGGFPAELFQNECIIDHIESGNAANGGGWIGRHERTPERDKNLYQRLIELRLGEDFVAMFLTARPGRWYAESIEDGYHGNNIRFAEILGTLFEAGCKEGWLKVEYVKNENQ